MKMIAFSTIFLRKNILILLPVVLLVTAFSVFLFNKYLTGVKICEPVVICVEGISINETKNIGFNGVTPLNRILKFDYIDSLRWAFRSFGSFTEIKISGESTVIEKISKLILYIGNHCCPVKPVFINFQ